ncbi:HAMP domain-containing histidine kinase [Paenisporosarcina quisquiliarum]|uniref:histidine kinase n=1 Tax=Paenisporosarcina quisquiliarum TaxID=365346 RepID=A0A9X3LIX5_9BACL|nr:HAMP domain-containing histidine kinase [Paenisporosarcina quisquiliarum]
MKQFMNQKQYYFLTIMTIALMTSGLIVVIPRYDGLETGLLLHISLVVLLSASLLIYPMYEKYLFRLTTIIVGAAYFYMLFFLYPETWSTFIFLCFIPAFSILFFDSKLFYFSLVFNVLLITLTFSYVVLIDQGDNYSHITMDLTGNIINFIGSQIIIYLIFYISSDRIKKQQLYYEELQQSERLKTTGQLAAAVAHEIRNPLTVVKGFLQFYENDSSVSKDVKDNFSMMIDELNTAEHVISQFLTTAKPDKDQKMETVDVRKALQSVADLLMSYGVFHQNNIELLVEEKIYIAANPIEFKQLLINLVKNAIEVSNKGDSVLIVAERKKREIEIRVVDTGFGMSAEVLKSLGSPFYSLKSKGTGLGLMICFNIVEKYNGTIHFESVEGKGTTVIVRFPVVTHPLARLEQ